ncbi:MAG: DUF3791 domain-containing protein [Lentisphaeria bacterium]|nr:DUF3791 domain-containing protein [Lentisphaeria bacterium]
MKTAKMFFRRLVKRLVRMYCYCRRRMQASASCPGISEEQAMSELSFQTFCIEFYSRHIHRPGPEVFRLFRESGLLNMLKRDYEDLHGMGMEALMQFFDEYLAKELELSR